VAIVAVGVGAALPVNQDESTLRPFIVQYRDSPFDFGVGNGRIGFGHNLTHPLNQWRENVTAFSYTIAWTDESLTPLSDPSVDVSVAAPGGQSAAEDNVPTQGQTIVVRVGERPSDVSVMATSSADAIAKASRMAGNSSDAMGTWKISITVKPPSSRTPMASADITYTEQYVLHEYLAEAHEA
jgi:hypothetical protein